MVHQTYAFKYRERTAIVLLWHDMSSRSRSYHRVIKNKFEDTFLDVLRRNIPEHILQLDENKPLIKDEKQMTMAPLYSPTCDVAIGPFSFAEGNLNDVYHNLSGLNEIDRFIRNLHESSLGDGYNERLLDLNQNPRCFIAVEVENKTETGTKRNHRSAD